MKSGSLTTAFAAIVLMASCSGKDDGANGIVRINLAQETDLIEVSTKSSVGDFTSLPSASDFKVEIRDSKDNVTVVNNVSEEISLQAGSYKVSASCGDLSDEGFDKPCFKGEEGFMVSGGQTSEVTVRVRLAGCIVRLEFTDNFRNYFTDYGFTLTTGGGTVIDLPKGETRAVFMDAFSFRISGSLVNQAGKTQIFAEKEFRNLDAATCYTMKFDASNVGAGVITISFDDSIVEADIYDVDLND